MRRLGFAAGALLILLPLPAHADDELADRLEGRAGADFHASGIVMCVWGGDSAAGEYEVIRVGGMSMTKGPAGDSMITESGVALRVGADWAAIDFADRSQWALSDRYRLAPGDATVRLGRAAHEYAVFEGEIARVRLVVDDLTSVPLVTEVLDGEGRVFRVATLTAIADPAAATTTPDTTRRRTVERGTAGPSMPEEVAGYRRVDIYEVAGGGVQGYYSDGLFSFSVFETDRGSPPPAFTGATRFEVGGHQYVRVVTPTLVWVYWASPDRSYVLVGDLPPDHLRAALGGLPDPGERGLLVRLWRRLFG